MSLKTGMFVFRLLQNEYSAIISALNPDLISGYDLCRRGAREEPAADVFYLLALGLCNHSFSHIHASFCSMSILKVISLVSLTWFYLAAIIQTQPSLSFTHIYSFFFTLMLCCRPLKICNVSVTRRNVPGTTACGRDKVVRRLFIMYICSCSRSAYQHCTTFDFSLVGGPCQKEKSNKSKHRICLSYCLASFVTEAKDGLFLYRNIHKNSPWAFNTIGQLDCGFRHVCPHCRHQGIMGNNDLFFRRP